MRPLTLLPVLMLTACAGWNNLPDQSNAGTARLWDPFGAIARADGLYVPLPHAGGLAFVDPTSRNTPYKLVDIGEGVLSNLTAAPDGETLVAFVDRFTCDVTGDDAKGIDTKDDCDNPDLESRTELSIVRDGKVRTAIDVEGRYNAISYANDGRFAIAWRKIEPGEAIDAVIDLTSVVALDLVDGETTPITVGFAAEQVLFVEDDGGPATKAVVLSQNEVAVIDLTASPPRREVTFPLTLDPDQVVVPVGVDLTPDGRYALISVRSSADLYALDLQSQSINIVELSGVASDMVVNPAHDRTVLVYSDTAAVDVLEHAFFDVETFTLDERMDHAENGSDHAMLWSDDGHDVYRVELETDEVVEYRLQNPAISMHTAPGERFAVALTRAESGFGSGGDGLYDRYPGMEILDLEDDESQPFLLEGTGRGMAFADLGDALYLALLQDAVDYLYVLDLYTGLAEEVELSKPPVAIGAMADGTFFITHDEALGLISFWDPTSGKITEVAGFGSLSLIDPVELDEKGGK